MVTLSCFIYWTGVVGNCGSVNLISCHLPHATGRSDDRLRDATSQRLGNGGGEVPFNTKLTGGDFAGFLVEEPIIINDSGVP